MPLSSTESNPLNSSSSPLTQLVAQVTDSRTFPGRGGSRNNSVTACDTIRHSSAVYRTRYGPCEMLIPLFSLGLTARSKIHTPAQATTATTSPAAAATTGPAPAATTGPAPAVTMNTKKKKLNMMSRTILDASSFRAVSAVTVVQGCECRHRCPMLRRSCRPPRAVKVRPGGLASTW
jgi:hypothetical protein